MLCVLYDCQLAMHLCGEVLALDLFWLRSSLLVSMTEVSASCLSWLIESFSITFFIASATSCVFAVAKTSSAFSSQIEIIAPLSSGVLMEGAERLIAHKETLIHIDDCLTDFIH
jgi:hypothetical protein